MAGLPRVLLRSLCPRSRREQRRGRLPSALERPHRREWNSIFNEPRLCAAIADRITFRCTRIQTGTESYRRTASRSRGGQAVPLRGRGRSRRMSPAWPAAAAAQPRCPCPRPGRVGGRERRQP
ncbi:ATP-binding protein [Streptomyces sp. CT34]|uniref:ATP-binding protein n=1 Tax=Streptomyces sp. CT34 TaxID=1553907 RepID=UPI00322015FA